MYVFCLLKTTFITCAIVSTAAEVTFVGQTSACYLSIAEISLSLEIFAFLASNWKNNLKSFTIGLDRLSD